MVSWYVVVVLAKFEEGMVERMVVYKFVESQDLKIVTMKDKFEEDLEDMILENKLMLMQGLEEDIKGDKFQQMQDLVGMRKVEMM